MPEQIKLYSDDFAQILLETDDRDVAHRFLRDSGEKSVTAVIDFGKDWKARWSGRIVLNDNATLAYVGASEYLQHIAVPPNPAFGDFTQDEKATMRGPKGMGIDPL